MHVSLTKGEKTNEILKKLNEKLHLIIGNLRVLISSLHAFYRVYSHMKTVGIDDVENYMDSFLAYSLAEKRGIRKNGKITFEFSDEELRCLYPRFSPEYMFESPREWVRNGIFDRAEVNRELKAVKNTMQA